MTKCTIYSIGNTNLFKERHQLLHLVKALFNRTAESTGRALKEEWPAHFWPIVCSSQNADWRQFGTAVITNRDALTLQEGEMLETTVS